MKRILSLATAAALATSLTTAAFANGTGTPIEPMPGPPTQLPPEGPATAQVITETQQGQNWWLIAVAAAVAIGIIIAVSDDNNSNHNSSN